MEDYIMTVIKRASIFMILTQMFLHFRPSPSYEKYFKFLIGIMTTVILILPFMELFQKGTMEQYQQRISYHMEKLQQLSDCPLPAMKDTSDAYFSAMEEEIKTRLNKTLSEEGFLVKEVFFLNQNGQPYEGNEKKNGTEQSEEMLLKVALIPATCQEKIQIPEIDRIQLTEEKTEEERTEDKKKEEEVKQQEKEQALRNLIADILEMEEEKVEVTVSGN